MPHDANPTSHDDSDDPIVASYDVYITDADIRRFLLQYPDRSFQQPYNDASGYQPLEFRMKSTTGLVEVDVPIDTRLNYDRRKGQQYGEALGKSRISQEGGTHGFAGGFNSGASNVSRLKAEDDPVDGKLSVGGAGFGMSVEDDDKRTGPTLGKQTLGGRIKAAADGDPVYMLAAFRGRELHLSPLSAVVQLRPQLHHIDAVDEVASKSKGGAKGKREDDDAGAPAGGAEARAIEMKVKSGDGEEANVNENHELLRKMQEEKWQRFDWIDENATDSWDKYSEFMFSSQAAVGDPPKLEAAIESEDYVDDMSAPRVDPTNPEMSGWAMKMSRKRRKRGAGIREEGDEGDDDLDATDSEGEVMDDAGTSTTVQA